MEKSGQEEINKEQESSGENRVTFIKEEVMTGSGGEADAWSAVLSSPKPVAGSDGLIDPLLEDENNGGENSDSYVDGWINDGMGNPVPRNDNHAMEKGIHSSESNTHPSFQQVHHEHRRGNREVFKCFYCDRYYSQEANLIEHMKVHAAETMIPVYPMTQSQLRRHMRKHRGGKGYHQGQKGQSRRQGPKTTFPWTDEQEEELVDWWRANECLYNTSAQGYLDRNLRETLFSSKAAEIGNGCTAEDVQTHLRSLRTKLNHILKDGGQGLGPIAEGWQPKTPRTRWVWEKLDFLLPFIIHRSIKSKQKGSSGEDSPSGGSDVSMGVELIPGTSNNIEVGQVSGGREVITAASRVRGKTKGGRQDSPSKKSRVDVGAQEKEIRTKPTTTVVNQSSIRYNPRTTLHLQSQVQEAPMTSIPSTTSSHHQPVVSTDEEEVKAFLGHLKCTLLKIPADLRMEVQADILAMVYARHREHRQACK